MTRLCATMILLSLLSVYSIAWAEEPHYHDGVRADANWYPDLKRYNPNGTTTGCCGNEDCYETEFCIKGDGTEGVVLVYGSKTSCRSIPTNYRLVPPPSGVEVPYGAVHVCSTRWNIICVVVGAGV